MNYYKRKHVWEGTVKIVCDGFYKTEAGKEVELSSVSIMCQRSYKCPAQVTVSEPERLENTVIEVNNIDCLKEVARLKEAGYNPALLNMANGSSPCACDVSGNTQEESIFRRTSLFMSLCQFYEHYYRLSGYLKRKKILIPGKDSRYPLFKGEAIYSPYVELFRDDESSDYKLLDTPVSFAVITSAAICDPDLTPDAMYLSEAVAEETKKRIRIVLSVGLQEKHDALVLGAWGCGAFGNPPEHMAKLFHEVLEESQFKNRFRLVSFAIIDDQYSGQFGVSNYMAFKKEFAI